MRKYIIIVCLIVLCSVLNIENSYAEEKYIYFGYYDGNQFIDTTGPGTEFIYSEYYINLNHYTKVNIFGKEKDVYKGEAYDGSGNLSNLFGGEEELDWNGTGNPYYIVVKNVQPGSLGNNVKWKGYDETIGGVGDHFFILEEYYKSQGFGVDKTCFYLQGADREFAIVKNDGRIYTVSRNTYYNNNITDLPYELRISEKVINKINNVDGCPNITYCTVSDLMTNEAGTNLPDEVNVFLDDQEAMEFGKCESFNWFYYIDEPIINTQDPEKIDYCDTYDTYYDSFKTNYRTCVNDYENCEEATTAENRLKSLCNSIFQTQDYASSSCLRRCLNLPKEIAEEKGFTTNDEECGFSRRLIVYFKNILRWIKYIMPVAVIGLSILDFIKAIGADKDDVMKKAQKKFVIRLISAALLFLIPFIIEFVLGKMGFGYDDCGLFK